MPVALPRRYKVAYSSSIASEIRKNVQLETGEKILYWSAVQERTNWLWMQPGVLQLTSQRLILLEHHAFSADWILEIPRFAIVNVASAGGPGTEWTAISYSIADAVETVEVRPLAFRGHPPPEKSGILLDAVRAFHSGELSDKFVTNSEKQHEPAAGPPSYSTVFLLVLLCVVMYVRLGVYVARLPGEWRAMEAYDASSDCNENFLAAQAELEQRGGKLAQASTATGTSVFCAVQTMTVLGVWSARGQHVSLMDSRGREYGDIDALNSVNVDRWWRMQPGEKVYVLLAGDQPAWIFHGGNLFETRLNPNHRFWEQSFLMLVLFFFCALVTALIVFVLRATLLARRHAALAQAG